MTADWKTPGSTLILPADAPREAWLEARRSGIGGSDVSAILGLNPFKSAYGVWLEKTGRLKEDLEETAAMRWGKLHEPAMRTVFSEDTGLTIRRTGLHRSKKYPHLLVTPDGLTSDGGVFESKTANWRVFANDWTDEDVADHAALQVCHSMTVTGRKRAHVMALTEGYIHKFYVVEYDPQMGESIAVHLEDWWEEFVVGDKEPPLTHASLPEVKDHLSVAVYDKLHVGAGEDRDVWDTMARIEKLKAEAKAKTQEADTLEAKMRLLAGEAGEILTEDESVLFTLRNDGTFSPTKFNLAVGPEVTNALTVLKPVLDMDAVKEKYPNEYRAARARVFRPKKQKEA